GVLEGDLDGESAVRIKERLAMATVLETETDTLRDELAEAKKVRRELQEQVEQLKKANASAPKTDPAAAAAAAAAAEQAKEKIEELEAESMVLAGKVNELEEELDLARAESVALQQKSKAEIDDLQREIKRINVDRASDRGDVERTTAEHMQTMQKLAREH